MGSAAVEICHERRMGDYINCYLIEERNWNLEFLLHLFPHLHPPQKGELPASQVSTPY